MATKFLLTFLVIFIFGFITVVISSYDKDDEDLKNSKLINFIGQICVISALGFFLSSIASIWGY